MKPAIEVRNLSFSYGSTVTLSDLSFIANRGEILLVAGQNGAGKSTLLKLLNGILRPASGEIVIDGKPTKGQPTSEIARSVAVTFQDPSDQLFANTIYKELQFSYINAFNNSDLTHINNALSMYNLQSLARKHPYDCSFAIRKLVSIASAVASQAPILAFDEPTAGLSEREHAPLISSLASLSSAGRTFLIVSHDLRTFLPLATRVLILQRGLSTFYGSVKELLSNDYTLRSAGLRLPQSLRLKRYVGLSLIPSEKESQRDHN